MVGLSIGIDNGKTNEEEFLALLNKPSKRYEDDELGS
jgi:hypothetical protein